MHCTFYSKATPFEGTWKEQIIFANNIQNSSHTNFGPGIELFSNSNLFSKSCIHNVNFVGQDGDGWHCQGYYTQNKCPTTKVISKSKSTQQQPFVCTSSSVQKYSLNTIRAEMAWTINSNSQKRQWPTRCSMMPNERYLFTQSYLWMNFIGR